MVCICFNPCLEDHFFVMEKKYTSAWLSYSSQYLNEFLVGLTVNYRKTFILQILHFLYIHHEHIFSKQILDSEGIHNLQLFNVEFKKLPIYVKKDRFGHHVISDRILSIKSFMDSKYRYITLEILILRTLIGPKK